MGRDKAQLLWGGVSWLEHAARTALTTSSRVIVVGRTRPDGWPLNEVLFLEDTRPDTGPLGGLYTALRWSKDRDGNHGSVLLLACDMPLLDREALQWLLEAAWHTQLRHGLTVRNSERIEPLFSVYTVGSLALIEQCLDEGRDERHFKGGVKQRHSAIGKLRGPSLHGLIESGDFASVTAPTAIAGKLRSLNTPDDLESSGRK
jgi:molybdopterin-guanine dinucleotide biosynthesis protein A